MPSPAHFLASAALNPAPAPTINARSLAAIANPRQPGAVSQLPRDASVAGYRPKAIRRHQK